MFIPCPATVLFSSGFRCRVGNDFCSRSCRPCAVLAVVRSSSMVVVCLSKLLMKRMSSTNPKMEKFASRPCSASLTLWFSLFRFSDSGFMM